MTSGAPAWALAIAYWMHMLATVIWIGGLAALALVALPAARRTMGAAEYAAFLAQVERRLQMVGWFSLAVLAATGMFQMSSSPFYEGFLEIHNPWSAAILVKHLAIGLMVIFSAYLTWGLNPALQRMALRQAAGREVDSVEREKLQRREEILLRLNLLVSVVVLALTAVARAA